MKEDLIKKLKDLNKKKEEEKLKVMEEERKIVEEKRLQLFMLVLVKKNKTKVEKQNLSIIIYYTFFRENSEELRFAAMAKRKKAIADLNYKVIQEKERVTKEQKLKKRELDNFENLETIKKQVNLNLLIKIIINNY